MSCERKALSYFQDRRLRNIVTAINQRMEQLIPDLNKNVFEAGILSPDGQLYAIFPTRTEGVSQEIMDRVLSEFKSEIEKATTYINPFKDIVAIATSRVIWETFGAFLVDNENPKILKNRTRSPFYTDGAAIYASPAFMNLISAFVQIELEMVLGKVDVIVGGETRGIPFASWIAKDLAIGTGIARKVIKDYRTGKGVDGGILPGEIVILLEDLVNDGESKGPFIVNIRNTGAEIATVIVIFDRKQGGEKYLREKFGVELISLTNIDTHLESGMNG